MITFKIKEYQKKYREEHKEESKKCNKRWRDEHREYLKNYKRKWEEEHKDILRERQRIYHKNLSPEQRKRQEKYRNEWRKRNPDKVKESNGRCRKRRYYKQYGLTAKDWQEIFDKQEGKCVICERHQSKLTRKLVVDHNHKTGRVRGLLCDNCNLIVGLVENKKDLFRKAEIYLEERNV